MLGNKNRCIAECRKFSPNIFNKNKCTLCFGKREEHNPTALDYNRASRKVLKCGYLFVAPHDWDWENPLYRTKRWQRRWFILFDDGELTYAVDDHPETLPQASINMSDVIEVADAEKITGHIHSILIQTLDKSTFVKGTCQEESNWWYQIFKSKTRHHSLNNFIKSNQKFSIDQPVSSKSPPTRDKLHPQIKARSRRETDTTDSAAPFYENAIREEQLKDIANKITNISSHEPDQQKRWIINESRLDETPTRDEMSNLQKRPQTLPIASSTPSIISVVKKNSFDVLNNRKSSHSHERGDPDGDCGIKDSPTRYCNKTAELRVKLPSEEILHSKSGWLMKQDSNGWSKYWFSLKGGGLFYYRTPTAEERGLLDGVLNVSSITGIKETTSPTRENCFQLMTWDSKRFVLSAVTSNVKNNWINALTNASGMTDDAISIAETSPSVSTATTPASATKNPPSFKEDDSASAQKKMRHSLYSSDDEYKTASEGQRESIDWGSPLSPSNPIQITLSQSKESKILSNLRSQSQNASPVATPRTSTVEIVDIAPIREKSEVSEKLTTPEKLSEVRYPRAAIRKSKEDKEKLMSLDSAKDVISKLTEELLVSRKKIAEFENQLQRGIEENDSLYRKLRNLESAGLKFTSTSSLVNTGQKAIIDNIRRMNSFSDLTCLNDIDPEQLDRDSLVNEYQELKERFEKVVNELKMMKKELKESHTSYDNLELVHTSFRNDAERKQSESEVRQKMMAERIQDLTNKYTSAEKQVRNLKQKLIKSDRRRSSSLKGKEVLQLQKELEDKVTVLEGKMEIGLEVETPSTSCSLRASPSRCETPERKSTAKLRRKSLDSVSSQPIQLLMRLNALEKKIENTSSNMSLSTISSDVETSIKPNDSLKMDPETSLKVGEALQEVQKFNQVTASQFAETIRVEQLLSETFKALSENHLVTSQGDEVSMVRPALIQLESQLKIKLSDLLKQRRILRETNTLTQAKDLELLAERLAFESVCFGKLRDSLSRAESSNKLGEQQIKCEISETAQLIAMLKAKICGKTSVENCGSLDVLAQVLARRLVLTSSNLTQLNSSASPAPVESHFIDDLLQQQNELNLITKRYKINSIENLAYDLAEETFNYMSENSSIQGVVQEAWRCAQETVNAELIQYEISHIMEKTAKRYENSLMSSIGFAVTSLERVRFEAYADAVQDSLRSEMEMTIAQLTQCYEENLIRIKQGQRRLDIEHEHSAGRGRQLLIEFADIIAHKALIDARIAVIRGDISKGVIRVEEGLKPTNTIGSLQKYESLFADLSEDMNIGNGDEILAEADFDFLFRNFAFSFSVNKPEMNDLCNVVNQLEEILLQLHNKIEPEASLSHTRDICLDNIKGISEKLEYFIRLIAKIISDTDNLTPACDKCNKLEEAIIEVSNRHDEETSELTQRFSEINRSLNQQIKDQAALVEQLRLDLSCAESNYRDKASQNEELMRELNYVNKKCLQSRDEIDELTQKLSEENEKLSELQCNYERLRKNSIHELKQSEESRCSHGNQVEDAAMKFEGFHHLFNKQTEMENASKEEHLRQKYQSEIEQLRTLCEKGLSAMESSHKRIIAELEAKHGNEISRLLKEKDAALAEETQATLQALESMRKAHQNEVERQVNHFKQEFLRKFNNGNRDYLESLVAHKEEKELSEVRQEILSLSEKYSKKCIEAISLEEMLKNSQEQLFYAQEILRNYKSISSNTNQTLLEAATAKTDSLPIPPNTLRDESKEVLLNLPLIPITKVKGKLHPRLKFNEGNRPENISISKEDATSSHSLNHLNSPHEGSLSPLDMDLKEMGRTFELEI